MWNTIKRVAITAYAWNCIDYSSNCEWAQTAHILTCRCKNIHAILSITDILKLAQKS